MTRRVPALLGTALGLVGIAGLASCATFDTDTAATVNGAGIDASEVTDVTHAFEQDPESLGVGSFDPTGAAGGDLTRQVLTLLIHNEVLGDALAAAGAPLSPDDVQIALDGLGTGNDALPDEAKQLLAERSAASSALDVLPPPDVASLEITWNRRPAETGALCLLVVDASTPAEAEAAAATLRGGSTVTATDTVQVSDGCLPVANIGSAFEGDDLSFFLDAAPGDVSRVFEPSASLGNTSYEVLQVRPWADALEGLTDLLGTAAGDVAESAAFVRADVRVASEYGVWNVATQNVDGL